MTILDRELSAYSSEPVVLFKFVRGTSVYRYAADTLPVTAPDGTYSPANIKPNTPSQDTDGTHSTLTLEVPRDFPIALMFQGGAPGSSIWLTVALYQRDVSEMETLWAGKVRALVQTGPIVKLSCDPLDKVWMRNTLRDDYGLQCSRRLYKCGVLSDDYTVDGVVSAISDDGSVVTATIIGSQADKWWAGGDIYFTRLDCNRLIGAHTGTSCTMTIPVSGIQVGDAFKLRRGCDHLWKRSDGSWGDCKTVFNNVLNFKGWPFVPCKNPFTTRIG